MATPDTSAYTHYVTQSKIASDVARQLALAGFAVLWVFKIDTVAGPRVPHAYLPAAISFGLALLLDLLQYGAASAVWSIHRMRVSSAARRDYARWKQRYETIAAHEQHRVLVATAPLAHTPGGPASDDPDPSTDDPYRDATLVDTHSRWNYLPDYVFAVKLVTVMIGYVLLTASLSASYRGPQPAALSTPVARPADRVPSR